MFDENEVFMLASCMLSLCYNFKCVQWSLPKRTFREADKNLQRTNLVARIEFPNYVITT